MSATAAAVYDIDDMIDSEELTCDASVLVQAFRGRQLWETGEYYGRHPDFVGTVVGYDVDTSKWVIKSDECSLKLGVSHTYKQTEDLTLLQDDGEDVDDEEEE